MIAPANSTRYCVFFLAGIACFTWAGPLDLPMAEAATAQFWFSTSADATRGRESPIVGLAPGQATTVYLWVQPAPRQDLGYETLHNLSLNLVAKPGSQALVDILDTFAIYDPAGTRFDIKRDADPAREFRITSSSSSQQVLNGQNDSVSGLVGAVARTAEFTGVGSIASDNGGALSPSTPAWRVASFEFAGVQQAGVEEFYLQIGEFGMNHQGDSTLETHAIFGAGPNETAYNAKTDRSAPADPADLPDLSFVGLPLLAGDFDRDADVDGADLDVFQSQFGLIGIGLAADSNASGAVGGDDFLGWQRRHIAVLVTDAAMLVPEPSPVAWIVCFAAMRILRSRAMLPVFSAS